MEKHRWGGKMISDDCMEKSQQQTGWLTGRQITVAEMKVGQLLVEAAIISPATLDSAINISAESHQTLETVLQQQFYLPPQTLKNIDKASAMIDSQLIERSTALEALLASHSSALDFADVIAQNNGGSPELEHLLVQSNMVSAGQLREAKRIGKERGMQIGASLFFMKVVSFTHLNYALDCLYMVKENRLSMGRAVIALGEVKSTNCNLQTALGSAYGSGNHVKVGELLLGGRVISEVDMLKNIEEAIAGQRLIGTLLVESGLVSESTLKDVLLLQNFCVKGVLDQRSAVKILRKSVESSQELTLAARSLNTFADDESLCEEALYALINAGFVSAEDVAHAQSQFENLNMGPLRALVADGLICASARHASLACAQLRLANIISEEEAIGVLHHCDRHNVGYEEAFGALGITKFEDRRRNLEKAISNEFNSNERFVPRLHKSSHFILMLFVLALTITGAIVLTTNDPCNLSTYGVILLALTAVAVIIRLGKFWQLRAKEQEVENEERISTAKDTVSRLHKGSKRRQQLENTETARV